MKLFPETSLLEGLSEPQIQAVTHKDGPIQVVSCAGSGKTRVITHRVAYLVSEYDTPPEEILAVTFTKKAATEMQTRLSALVSEPVAQALNVRTFHSACFKILRNEIDWYDPTMRGFNIITEYQQLRLMTDTIRNVFGKSTNNIMPGEILRLMGLAKNNLDGVGECDKYDIPPSLWEAYDAAKRSQRLYDFDDLLVETWKMFDRNEWIRAAYSGVLRYYLVDEFQDTNKAQFEILRLLTQDNPNIMVVGDDDQSIYSWRGAVPEYTIKFKELYPDAEQVYMETNYRSHRTIIDHANALIGHNTNRLWKRCVANSEEEGRIIYIPSVDERSESATICDEIQEITANCDDLSDISILYRTNAQSRGFEDQCVKRGIPYTIVGSIGFYNRKEIKDIIAFLRVVEYDDDESLKRIINTPSRYLGKVFMEELAEIATINKCSLFKAISLGQGGFSRPYMGMRSKEFSYIIWQLRERRQNNSPGQMVRYARDLFQYDLYVTRDEVESDPDNSRVQNLDELEAAAKDFSTLREFLEYVESMCSRAPANSDEDQTGKVQMLTLHRAKGLEWDVVFVVGASDGLLPHKRAESYEEERRLMYVGMTRARKRLYVSSLELYQGKALGPSGFLYEAEIINRPALPESTEIEVGVAESGY